MARERAVLEARLANDSGGVGDLERDVDPGLVDEQMMDVLCKCAPLGYERLQGQRGLLSSAQLPDMTFHFRPPGESIQINNSSGWEFEQVPVTSPAVEIWATALMRLRALIGSRQRIVRSPWSDCVGQETTIEDAHANVAMQRVAVSFDVRHDGDVRRCGIGESNWNEWKFEHVTDPKRDCELCPQPALLSSRYCARCAAAHSSRYPDDETQQLATTDGKPFDDVNHPKHYNVHRSGVECIEVMERLGANLGSAFKYLWRADDKHETPLVDLKKAIWYLRREQTIAWEKSTATEERLRRVVLHESFTIGSAMLAIFDAACSENHSNEKLRAIDRAVDFIEMELRKLSP